MRIFLSLLFFFTLSFGADASIEVVKKVDVSPGVGVEDSSTAYDESLRNSFFKTLVSDLNVLSLFNVDRQHYTTNYENSDVVVENRDKDYVIRYKVSEEADTSFNVTMKIMKKSVVVATKNYKLKNKNLYVFVAHAMAFDVNEYMGAAPVNWIKSKVLIARLVSPGQSEILICDYTLTFSQRIVKGGINVFPKWANKDQSAFYYTYLLLT